MRSLKIGDPVGRKFQARVERNDAVAGVRKVAAGSERSDVGLFAEFARDADHAVERPGVVHGSRRLALPRRAIVDQQRAQGPVSGFTGHARAELGIFNLAGKKQGRGSLEKAGIFDEERPLFREENGKALVDGDLRIVGFHLAEVGIQGDVKGKRVFRNEFRVQSGAVLESSLISRRGSGGAEHGLI